MDTFWLKTAVFAAVIIVGIGAVVVWTSKGIEEAQSPETTFDDMVAKDEKTILSEPNVKDLTGKTDERQVLEEDTSTVTEKETQPQPQPEPVTFYFTELSDIDQIEAERLMAMVPSGRSLGRLPMTGFSLMVETCTQIMNKWPGSIYDYKARRALKDIPEQYRNRYGIKPEDLDLTMFTKPRPGTKPYTIEQEEY